MWRLHQVLLLFLSFCLAQTDPLRSQIVGGHEAVPHSRPYMAYLRGTKYLCGGFLVAPQWVMTAAHCTNIYKVILGAHNRKRRENTWQEFYVVRSIPYYGYDNKTYFGDIRLLKLNARATLNEYVGTLPLPKFNIDLPAGTPCSVAGWGLVYTDWLPKTLHETNVTIYDHWKCWSWYPYMDYSRVCAGSPDKPADSAKGDSGGPLVCDGVAQGIVSYGNPCPPGVYTRIAHFLGWIKTIMES